MEKSHLKWSTEIKDEAKEIKEVKKVIKETKPVVVPAPITKVEPKTPLIKQLALNNQLIRTYISLDEASRHTGIERIKIEDACAGDDGHVFAGCKWMYI